MKFSHIADCHIGGWRDPRMNDINSVAFIKAMTISIQENVDFILIAGDLFNTALPGIDKLKEVTKQFKKLQELNIPIYIIPGSHDFSPSGKTMLDVLEEAGLCINVVKGSVNDKGKLILNFTVDQKTGAKITGMLGKRGMLERKYYEELDKSNLESSEGFKIFMFHTSLSELKPDTLHKMESNPISYLPKGFDYYAGGHVHIVEKKDLPGYKNVIYPGPTFPNSFSELEELKGGGFYIYDNGNIVRKDIQIKPIKIIDIDAEHKTSQDVTHLMLENIHDISNQIVLIRISGELKEGKISQIEFRKVYELAYAKGAYYVMRNTSKLTSSEFEEAQIETKSSENVEEDIINEHIGQMKLYDQETEKKLIKNMMKILGSERMEGEKVYEFESRIKKEMKHFLDD